jgi:hypothetical protein
MCRCKKRCTPTKSGLDQIKALIDCHKFRNDITYMDVFPMNLPQVNQEFVLGKGSEIDPFDVRLTCHVFLKNGQAIYECLKITGKYPIVLLIDATYKVWLLLLNSQNRPCNTILSYSASRTGANNCMFSGLPSSVTN